jgi:hypothetical protein
MCTVFMLGFWLCQCNREFSACGCVCHRQLTFLFGDSNLMYVVYVMVGDVCGLSLVVCHLCNFKIVRLGQGLCCQSLTFLSLILACQHGI